MDKNLKYNQKKQINYKTTNLEETKRMVKEKYIGKKVRKVHHRVKIPNTAQPIPKNTKMNNRKKSVKNKNKNMKI